MVKIAFGDGEDPVFFLEPVELAEIVFHLLTEKVRHLDRAVTFLCFRRSNHILSMHALIGLVDPYRFLLKVKVRRSKRQQLTFTDSAPIQHLKCVIGTRLLHHHFCKLLVFLRCPEQHFLVLFGAHVANLRCRISLQFIVADSMVENGTQLIVQRFQIRC